MPTSFFTAPGQFYRGNLHCHSTGSDGVLEPQEVCKRYQAEGYDFIALTDHCVGMYDYPLTDTTPFRNDNFTTLIGAELHIDAMENGHMWHIVAVGLPLDFTAPDSPDFQTFGRGESITELTNRAADAGAFIAIAHPHWSGLTDVDMHKITAAHAVEIYNHGCMVENDRGDGLLTYERALNEGRRLSAIATDDAHFGTPDHFGGWVMVKALENSPEALLAALKAGEFYASTGPEIHDFRISDDGSHAEIKCSPVSTVVIQGPGIVNARIVGSDMTSASLSMERFSDEKWVKLAVIDANGKRAWSNPIWLND